MAGQDSSPSPSSFADGNPGGNPVDGKPGGNPTPSSTAGGNPGGNPAPSSTADGGQDSNPSPSSSADGNPSGNPPSSTADGNPSGNPTSSTADGNPGVNPTSSTAVGNPSGNPPSSTAPSNLNTLNPTSTPLPNVDCPQHVVPLSWDRDHSLWDNDTVHTLSFGGSTGLRIQGTSDCEPVIGQWKNGIPLHQHCEIDQMLRMEGAQWVTVDHAGFYFSRNETGYRASVTFFKVSLLHDNMTL